MSQSIAPSSRVVPFRVERWFDDHETRATYNLAETCAASLSIDDLKALSEDKSAPILRFETKLLYGPIKGSHALRSHLSSLYSAKTASPLPIDQILITAGAINANFLGLYALLNPGDHVICHYPTYQQLYSVPESLGAEVSLWRAKPQNQWMPDVEELKALIKPNTKMIIINNPQNPTGAFLPKQLLLELVEVCREHNLILFADEVYRPLFHGVSPVDAAFPPSVLSLPYARAVATSSMSKAFALAGIRVGWIASRDPELMIACAGARDYTNISVSQVDDQIATYALSPTCVHALLGRNIQLARENCAILGAFIDAHRQVCNWVRPRAGTTAFVRFHRNDQPVDDVAFCEALQAKTGVFVAPGNQCFAEDGEFPGYVRVGYVCETKVLQDGLAKLKEFLETDYAQVPLAKRPKNEDNSRTT